MDGNVSIPELTVTQQLPDAILVVEVFGVSKLGTLPARDGAGSPLGGGCRGLVVVVLRRRRRSLIRLRVLLVVVVVGLTTTSSAAAAGGTSDSNVRETQTHDGA